jgi:ATP-binding cassette subfamily B protein
MARGGIPYLMNHLWIIAAILIALYAVGSVFQYLRGRWTAQASEQFCKTLRDRLYGHLQHLSYDYHVKAQTGDLIQRCTSDVDTIRGFLSSQLVEISAPGDGRHRAGRAAQHHVRMTLTP